ncbi:UBX domain-containing 11 isoform X1 [Labeo rohita]|uniref:UBX domain-containing 11 isoform X1 n=1 Tax=Labeo rohita TaxID=84645 RepID=A0A498NKT4_LABRO|nr:UBX domain-containing 11 isoform X1 [Labeo rohita]
MSSPLSTLRKNKRVPLPDIQSDGERKPYKERSDTDYEAKLFRDIFPQNQSVPHITDGLSAVRSKVVQKKKAKEAPPSDFELMSSMMQKIVQLERKVKTQAVDIEQKARRIAVLEEKLNILQKAKEKSTDNENQHEELVKLCLKFQNQVWEMENAISPPTQKFLNDYGMIWVGSYEEHDEQANSQLPGATNARRSFEMNFDLVLQNIQELNITAGEGESHVIAIPGGAKLTQKSSIPLWLYKNGIVMFSGPFRSYQDPSTQVHDKRDEEFIVRKPGTEFPGRGQSIDGAGGHSFHKSEQTSSTAPKQSQIPGKKLSIEQFLRKLPETVVKEGKVISIRDSIKAHLLGFPDGVKSHSATTVETSALQALRERETDSTQSAEDITTLRLKSENAMETFIIKMYFNETIGDLRHYLDLKRF